MAVINTDVTTPDVPRWVDVSGGIEIWFETDTDGEPRGERPTAASPFRKSDIKQHYAHEPWTYDPPYEITRVTVLD